MIRFQPYCMQYIMDAKMHREAYLEHTKLVCPFMWKDRNLFASNREQGGVFMIIWIWSSLEKDYALPHSPHHLTRITNFMRHKRVSPLVARIVKENKTLQGEGSRKWIETARIMEIGGNLVPGGLVDKNRTLVKGRLMEANKTLA